MPTPDDEARWVLRAQGHDRDALESLLRSALPPLQRYLGHLIGPEHVDDISQDVLIVVCKKIGWLRRADLFRPWLFRIASRSAFRYLRKEKRWFDQVRDPEILDDVPAPQPPSPDSVRELLGAQQVSPASRAVLVLHFQEGLTLPEIAAALEVPLGTVKSRLAYGLSRLRKQMDTKESHHDGTQ
jgi:RNA polymerase sigma-70 factor (ECF subfamily)